MERSSEKQTQTKTLSCQIAPKPSRLPAKLAIVLIGTVLMGAFLFFKAQLNSIGCVSPEARTHFALEEHRWAYLEWWKRNSKPCPDQLSELGKFFDFEPRFDGWDRPIRATCDASPGAPFPPLVAVSAGPDKVFGTIDDISLK